MNCLTDKASFQHILHRKCRFSPLVATRILLGSDLCTAWMDVRDYYSDQKQSKSYVISTYGLLRQGWFKKAKKKAKQDYDEPLESSIAPTMTSATRLSRLHLLSPESRA